jgi:NAD(P)H dehydrogenase (quinone)
MAAEVKKFLDDSVKFHGELDGKVGGAFSSSANVAGGNETTIISILQALLIHGMVVQGMPNGDHYGPVAIGKPDDRCKKLCREYGHRIAKLVLRTAT